MDTDLRETMRRTTIMKKENSIPVRNSLLLLLTATIWGVAFVAQSVSMDYIGGFTFNAVRNLIGALTLLPVIWGLGKTKAPEEKKRIQASSDRKTLITGGICCGILLCFASNFQQFGIKYTSVGKAGFITACYIVIVPIIGIFLKKKCSPFIWAAVAMALVGLYLLCITDGFSIGKQEVDLRYVEQLIDSEQTGALGALLKYAVEKLIDGKRTLPEIVELLCSKLEKEGLSFLPEGYTSCGYAVPRRQEVYACFNRYRRP